MAQVYCRKCLGLADAHAPCPTCGNPDPSGNANAAWGALVVGSLIATAVTGVYAFVLSEVWDWWLRQFQQLPPGHVLIEQEETVAYVLGVAIFAAAWFLAVYVLWSNTPVTKPETVKRTG